MTAMAVGKSPENLQRRLDELADAFRSAASALDSHAGSLQNLASMAGSDDLDPARIDESLFRDCDAVVRDVEQQLEYAIRHCDFMTR